MNGEMAKEMFEDLQVINAQLSGDAVMAMERLVHRLLRVTVNPTAHARDTVRVLAQFQNVYYGQPKDPDRDK